MTLGDRIRKAREAKQLTQEELGKILNVSDATINRYENNKRSPDISMLRKISEVLNVSLDYLAGRTDDMHETIGYIETIAAHRSDDPMTELPEEARRSLEDYKNYLLKKHGLLKDED